MLINKIYPHVNVTTTALLRRTGEVVNDSATTLFVPFISKKGPANEVRKIYSLNQFIAEYGEPDFVYQGRTILNIYNWLTAGGAIYALRLVGNGVKATSDDEVLSVTAKYEGEYYNGISLVVSKSSYSTVAKPLVDAEIRLNNVKIQTIYRLSEDTFVSALENTEYFSEVSFKEGKTFADDLNNGLTVGLKLGSDGVKELDTLVRNFFHLYSGSTSEINSGVNNTVSFNLSNDDGAEGLVEGSTITLTNVTNDATTTITGTVGEIDGVSVSITVTGVLDGTDYSDWTVNEKSMFDVSGNYTKAYELLGNKLETPIDMILDAGLNLHAKNAIAMFTKNHRSDITVIFDEYDFEADKSKGVTVAIDTLELNHGVYTQKAVINDVISGKDIWVTPTYFLASLIPFNDRIYGMQWPTAGLTRGVLTGVKGINFNPTEEQKQQFYTDRINYIEKDSRGYTFMSQSSREIENTALRFLNNVRVANRMVRDLENLGREYLFEFNDTATLNNMRLALSRYVDGWIQNRTLSLAEVLVEKDENSDERVNVLLNIRFTGTIEIISIGIVIE